jgi:hypothetical protein
MYEKFTLTKVRQQQIIVVYETNTSLVYKWIINSKFTTQKIALLAYAADKWTPHIQTLLRCVTAHKADLWSTLSCNVLCPYIKPVDGPHFRIYRRRFALCTCKAQYDRN